MTLSKRLGLLSSVALLIIALLALLAVACDDEEAPPPAPPPDEPAGETPAATEAPPEEMTSVTIQFDWIAIPIYAPISLAVEKGFFAEEGLDVIVEQGGPGAAGMAAIDAGQTEFYFGALDEVPYDVAQGMRVKAVAAITHGTPSAIMVPSDSPIQSIEDLAGTIGAPAGGGLQTFILPDFLESNGVDPSTVEVVEVDPGVLVPSLLAGQFNAVLSWRNDSGSTLVNEDPDSRFFLYNDHGWDFFQGFGLVTNQRMIDEQPEVVRGVVRAVLRAYAYAAENTEEAFQAGANMFPEAYLEPGVALDAMEVTWPWMETPDTQTYGLGYMSSEEWQDMVDVEANYGPDDVRLTDVRPVEEYFTNEFLPEEPVQIGSG